MTDGGRQPPPAGWYQDPSDGRGLRWWDGARWTEHTSVVPSWRPDPRVPLEAERSIARWARHGVVVYAFLSGIAGALTFRAFSVFRDIFSEILANPAGPPPQIAQDPFLGASVGAMAGLQFVNLVQLGLTIMLLIWVYRAATAAAAVGIPAERSPGWAVGSWFIPILNVWWPYQSLRDLLPEDHPLRKRLLTMWIGWILGGLLAVVGLLTWIFGFDAGLWIGAVGHLAASSAVLGGRALIDAVLASHEDLVSGRAGQFA